MFLCTWEPSCMRRLSPIMNSLSQSNCCTSIIKCDDEHCEHFEYSDTQKCGTEWQWVSAEKSLWLSLRPALEDVVKGSLRWRAAGASSSTHKTLHVYCLFIRKNNFLIPKRMMGCCSKVWHWLTMSLCITILMIEPATCARRENQRLLALESCGYV